jgi:hypothetical protein
LASRLARHRDGQGLAAICNHGGYRGGSQFGNLGFSGGELLFKLGFAARLDGGDDAADRCLGVALALGETFDGLFEQACGCGEPLYHCGHFQIFFHVHVFSRFRLCLFARDAVRTKYRGLSTALRLHPSE